MTTRAQREQLARHERQQTEEEKKAWRSEFRKLKEKIYEFEKTNRRYLVLYCYTPGWWRMGGNSALIYYHRVSKQLGTSPKLKADRDFFAKFNTGVITIRDIESLRKKLAKVNIYPYKEDNGRRIIFKLERTLTEEEIKIMQEADAMRRKQFNNLVLPEVKFPQYYADLRTLCEKLLPQIIKMNGPQRELYGMQAGKKLASLRTDFIRMANGQIDQKKYLERAIKELQWLRAWLAGVSDAKLFGIEASLRLAENIVNLCEEAERALEKCKEMDAKTKATTLD